MLFELSANHEFYLHLLLLLDRAKSCGGNLNGVIRVKFNPNQIFPGIALVSSENLSVHLIGIPRPPTPISLPSLEHLLELNQTGMDLGRHVGPYSTLCQLPCGTTESHRGTKAHLPISRHLPLSLYDFVIRHMFSVGKRV